MIVCKLELQEEFLKVWQLNGEKWSLLLDRQQSTVTVHVTDSERRMLRMGVARMAQLDGWLPRVHAAASRHIHPLLGRSKGVISWML